MTRFVRAALLVGLALNGVFNAATLWQRRGNLSDFGSFVESGRAIERGQNPYGVYALTHSAVIQGTSAHYRNLNPPLMLLPFESLARFEPMQALRVWRLISAMLYILTLILLTRAHSGREAPLMVAWALSLPGFYDTLASGQLYVVVLAAVAAATLCLGRQRFLPGGLLIGVAVAMKTNLLVWPMLLLLGGHRRVAYCALATVMMLGLIPMARYGPGIYAEWWAATASVTWGQLPHNASLFGLTARLGLPGLGIPLAATVLGALGMWAFVRRPSILDASGAAICAALLASPLAWSTSLLLLVPAFFGLRWTGSVVIAALLLAVPTALVLGLGVQSPASAIAFGMLYPLGLFVALAQFTSGTERKSAQGQPSR